ncbi:MAG: hypothetical protein ABW184_14835 [Sphingobium sp.]
MDSMSADIIDRKRSSGPDRKDQHKPLTHEEKLEEGLEDSMDASDPPAATAPGDHGNPVPSSGYTEEDKTT